MSRSMLWLGGALFMWGIGESMFLLFQPIYLQQLGANPIQIGVILGIWGAVMTFAHIPAGYLSDRIGRRPLLIAAWASGIFATLLMGIARTLPAFVAGIFLYGFTAFVASPLDSYTTAARGNWSVARAITYVSMMFNAGAVVGPVTGGWIGDHYGLRTVYFIASGLFVISTILVTFISSQPREHSDPVNPPPSLLTNRRYIGFLAIYFAVAYATYLPQPFTPSFLKNERGLTLTVIGQLGSIGYLGNSVLNLVLGQLEARLGFVLGQLGVAAYSFILWQATGFGWYALGYFLLGGFRALRGLGVAQVRPFVHESQMGLAYGIAETCGSATVLLAPPVAGYLYAKNPALVYPVGLALIGLGVLLTVLFVPRSEKLPPERIELAPDL
ncbi:MAG TPA: MFS transporter [Anaerolineales bacterium]|nr:MFS transporter [Anaerolineales bacterium]